MRPAQAAVVFLALALPGACTNTARFGGEPETAAAPPPDTPPAAAAPSAPEPAPAPPTDLAGKWKLSVAGGGICLMTLAANPGANEGKIAPAGGCPGNFFTSRKWTYEGDVLAIRDFKGQALAELSFADGHFEGKNSAGAITLARP